MTAPLADAPPTPDVTAPSAPFAAPFAAMARAAARTPGAAFLRLDPGRAALLTDASTRCLVPRARPEEAVDALGAALDALPRDGDPEVPVAALCLGYDAAWRGASPRPVRDARPWGDACPAAWLCRYDAARVVSLDGAEVTRRGDPSSQAALDRLLAAHAQAPPSTPWRFEGDVDRATHMASVEALREAIRDGEVYLVNLARRLRADVRGDEAAWGVAARVVASEARYAAVLRPGECLVGAMSMELALAWCRASGRAVTRPIKGTRPRRDDVDADRAEARALAADPKERAENAMAVDVHRNDLGRVADAGSVTVPSLWEPEAHRYVHHLTSTVEARVDGKTPAREVLRAMLPVGSVTGAPKLAAMAHIARFERTRRGLYTGVYGAVMGDGSWRLAVAIRTLVAGDEGVSYGVGGGIVWDSDAAREWDELGWKQRAAERAA